MEKANVTVIFKKGDRHTCTNYRPVSLLSCIGKLMERCVHNNVFGYLKENNLLTLHQSGFIPKDSTTYQLLGILLYMTTSANPLTIKLSR